jgi:hypothetical protein
MSDEDVEVEYVEAVVPDDGLPAYLNAPKEIRGEARRAFALHFLISSEGVLAPNWLPTWASIVHYLESGEALPMAQIKALKLLKSTPE